MTVPTVLFPFTDTTIGGSYVSSSLIVRGLVRDGRVQPMVCMHQDGANASLFQQPGVQLVDLPIAATRLQRARQKRFRSQIAFRIQVYLVALRTLRRVRPDLVHINDDRTMLTFGSAARTLGIPVVWHVRQQRRAPFDFLFRRLASRAIFIAAAARERFASAPLRRGTVILNGTDTDAFHPPRDRAEAKAALGFPPDARLLGFVGRLTREKRPEWSLRAAVELAREDPRLQLLVVGEAKKATYRDGLASQVPEDLRDRVHFLGVRHDVPAIMRALDVLSVPSAEEPFGLVVIEAMASGAAVVATRAGGIPEIIEDGRTGLLVGTEDFASFRDGIARLLRDSEQRERLTVEGLEAVRRRFAIERVVDSVITVYQELLPSRATASQQLREG